MPKVSDLNEKTARNVADPREIRFLLSDINGTPTSEQISLDELSKASQLIVLTHTSHGLTAADEGKPLVGVAILDDVDSGVYPNWVLYNYLDANTVVVAPLGALVDLPTYLLDGGDAYDVDASGYKLFYDTSLGKYTATRPTGSAQVDPILHLVAVNTTASTFTAIVLATGKPGTAGTVFEVVGTGNKTYDDPAFLEAFTAANAAGDGSIILINGTVEIANDYSFTAAVSLLGKPGTEARLRAYGNGGKLDWNGSYSGPITSGTTIPPTQTKQPFLPVPPGTLADGDWFIVASDDTIEGVTHQTGPASTVNKTISSVNTSTDTFTTSSAHGFVVGQTVTFTTSNTLPGGISKTLYYIAAVPSSTTFTVSASSGGAVVDVTSSGTGTHTVWAACTADSVTDTITHTANGFADNYPVVIKTTGTMPGGLSENTTYWIVNKATNSYKLAATRGGSAINITTNGSGAMIIRTIVANCPAEIHQVKEVRGSAPTNVVTSLASNTFTATGHGYVNGHVVRFTTTGSLPSGLSASTGYFIVNKTTNTFQVAATLGGSALTVSGGSGTLTAQGYDYVVFDDYIYDALTVNPRIVKVTGVFDGVSVSGLRLAHTAGTTTQDYVMFDMRKCVNGRFENNIWEYNGPTALLFQFSADCIATNNLVANVDGYDTDDGYVFVVGTVNNVLITNFEAKGSRHVFTTTAPTYNGARYGTPRNVVVSQFKISMNGRSDSSLILLDTHPEGWGVVFRDGVINVPAEPKTISGMSTNSNIGAQSRSRGTRFRNLEINGNAINYGVHILASDCRVEYCTFNDCWRGVTVRENVSGGVTSGCDRTAIVHNDFDDCLGPAVMILYGDSHRVTHNSFNDCGQSATAPITAAIIYLDGGSDYVVQHNNLDKGSNTYSIGGPNVSASDFRRLSQNSMIGYTGVSGATDSGFESANADAVALQSLADTYNVTD